MEAEQGYLRGTIVTKWDADVSDAAVGVEPHIPYLVEAKIILFPEVWKYKRAKTRQPDLSAVRMPG